MKTLYRCLAPTLLLVLAGVAAAGPSFSVGAGLFGDVELADGSEAGLKSWSAEMKWTQVRGQGATILEHSLGGSLFEFDGLALEDKVGEAAYRLTWIRNPSPQRTWIVMLQPTVASSFEADLGWDDFNLTAAVVRLTHKSPTFSWGWGLAYTMQFGAPFPVPLLNLRWSDGGRWSLEAMLPGNIALDRDLGRGWRVGGGLDIQGGQYRLDPDAHPIDNPQLQRVEVVLGPHLAWSPSEGEELRLHAGWAVHRELKLMDGADDYEDLEPETGASIGVSARLGF